MAQHSQVAYPHHDLLASQRWILNSSAAPVNQYTLTVHQIPNEPQHSSAYRKWFFTSFLILFFLSFFMVRAFTHGAMGCQINPSWVGPLSYFSFQQMLHDWCNKGCGMYYPVCGMMHIK